MSRRRNGFPVAPIDGLFQTELGTGNRLMLPDDEILKNVRGIQEADGSEKVAAVSTCRASSSIEMPW